MSAPRGRPTARSAGVSHDPPGLSAARASPGQTIAGGELEGRSAPVVAFVADRHYAMPLAAALASLIANRGIERALTVFVVDGGLSATAKARISQLAEGGQVTLRWLEPAGPHFELMKSLPGGYVGRACYFKMFLPELVGPEHPRIIYLDCDVIVEADIAEIWDADLGDAYVLAVQDLINPRVSSPFGLRSWRALGRRAEDPLFNSGVLVINAARWREENVRDSLVEWLEDHHRDVQLCDQDAMNAVFGDQWRRLDLRWNVLPDMRIARRYSLLSRQGHQDLLADARILHFCGPSKPWNRRCRHPRRDRYFHYLDQTAWAGWRPTSWRPDLQVISYYRRRVEVVLRRALGK